MSAQRKYLVLFTAAYLLSSQGAVVCIMSEILSSGGAQAVAWRTGPVQEHAFLSWTPRTHLPAHEEVLLPTDGPPTLTTYPADNRQAFFGLDCRTVVRLFHDFVPTGNKAPPHLS